MTNKPVFHKTDEFQVKNLTRLYHGSSRHGKFYLNPRTENETRVWLPAKGRICRFFGEILIFFLRISLNLHI